MATLLGEGRLGIFQKGKFAIAISLPSVSLSDNVARSFEEQIVIESIKIVFPLKT